MRPRLRHAPGRPSGPSAVEETTRWERVAGILTWYVAPTIAIGLVAAYVALAVLWHANPPAIPVTGHSMQPTLWAGDLVFVHGVDPKTLKKGDIIAFHTTQDMQKKYDVPPEYVHRIVQIQKTGSGGLMFRTKGDNVAGPDPFWTYDRDVVGRYVGKLSGAGYPLLFFRSKQGKIFGAAIVVVLLLYFVFGIWERRQEAIETNAVTMAQIVDEARTLRDSMLVASGGARAPPAVEPAAAAEAAAPEAGTVEQEPPAPEAASEPGYVPVWEREQPQHLAEFELAPAYVEGQPGAAEPPAFPAPPSIDFERLEREIHEAVRRSGDVEETMRELVGAIGEYGVHLRSHTAVMQNLAAATGDLQSTTGEMRDFLASLTALLTSLVQQQRPPDAP